MTKHDQNSDSDASESRDSDPLVKPSEAILHAIERRNVPLAISFPPYTDITHLMPPSGYTLQLSDPSTQNEVLKQQEALQAEINKLKAAVREAKHGRAQTEKELAELKSKQELDYLVSRVSAKAGQALFKGSLKESFDATQRREAFVISIDIRRSTELMLKARQPKDFAEFVTELCAEMSEIVKKNGGIFDKFTGDGVLAFFPKFFTGDDAGYLTVRTADECHLAFDRHYKASRQCFTSILKDTGLGIGIDFGNVQIVRINGELTVVGTPVVYACRMGSAKPTQTLLNQPAYDQIFGDFSEFLNATETEIEFKHEGRMVAYEVSLNEKQRSKSIAKPEWLKAIEKSESSSSGV